MTETTDTPDEDTRPRTGEVTASLNGFDEIAISKAFGADIMDLQQAKPMSFLRALVFVLKRREGMKDGEAKNAALTLTIREVNDTFADEEDDVPGVLDEDDDDPKES